MDDFQKAGQSLITGAVIGMYLTAREIMAESLVLAPIDTGTLRRSARIGEVVYDGVSAKVTLGYGYGDEINPKTRRPASDYAVPVHEILEAHHEPPTQAKFLEIPVLLNARTLQPTMEATMTKIIRRDGQIITTHAEQLVFPNEAPGPMAETLMVGG